MPVELGWCTPFGFSACFALGKAYMNFLIEPRDSQSVFRGLSHKSIILSGYVGLALVLPTAVENIDREMLSSKISKNNTGSYAQLIEDTSDLIGYCLNASHLLLIQVLF